MPDLIILKDNYSTLIDELKTVCDNDNSIDISEHEVRLLFKELNSRKSPDPDNNYIAIIVKAKM